MVNTRSGSRRPPPLVPSAIITGNAMTYPVKRHCRKGGVGRTCDGHTAHHEVKAHRRRRVVSLRHRGTGTPTAVPIVPAALTNATRRLAATKILNAMKKHHARRRPAPARRRRPASRPTTAPAAAPVGRILRSDTRRQRNN